MRRLHAVKKQYGDERGNMAKDNSEQVPATAREVVVSVFDAKSVELKPGSRYLLLLRGDNIEEVLIQRVALELKRLGFDSLVVALPSDIEAMVIEQVASVPAEHTGE